MKSEGNCPSSINAFNRGSFAIVKKAVNKKTGEHVAIKIIERYNPILMLTCDRHSMEEDDEIAL